MNHSASLENELQKHFNYSSFRLGQKEIIEDVMKGHNVLGVLPTGLGKSICYQLPAKLQKGSTIVVSPLISLMVDQVKELKAINFKDVIALNSFMDYQERKKVYRNLSSYKLIYVSPEIIQQPEVLNYLKKINVSLFVIDEAHCISQWGHEFRPDYLKLNKVIKSLQHPPVLALSATATTQVQKDIVMSLERSDVIKHIYPMDRPNIAFSIEKVTNDKEKLTAITKLLSNFNVPTLIYFSSRNTTESISEQLTRSLPEKNIAFYHGGMEQMDRITIQQQFMNDQLDVICCTSAFGMGINKENIRLVIHYHFPSQLESYIQEVGRAGRDGSSSVGLLLYSNSDDYIPKRMILNELPDERNIKFVFRQLLSIAKKSEAIPSTELQVEKTFQINEVQWRFLNSQLEKHGIIDDGKLQLDLEKWKKAFEDIVIYRNKRLLLKQTNLLNMIKWINTEVCLREKLYETFQDSYRDPKYQCCSNCDFLFSKWKPIEVLNKIEVDTSWQEKLKSLLLIGVNNENESE